MGMGSTPISMAIQLTYDALTMEWATTGDLVVRLPWSMAEAEKDPRQLVALGVAEQKLEEPSPRMPRMLWRRTDWATQRGG